MSGGWDLRNGRTSTSQSNRKGDRAVADDAICDRMCEGEQAAFLPIEHDREHHEYVGENGQIPRRSSLAELSSFETHDGRNEGDEEDHLQKQVRRDGVACGLPEHSNPNREQEADDLCRSYLPELPLHEGVKGDEGQTDSGRERQCPLEQVARYDLVVTNGIHRGDDEPDEPRGRIGSRLTLHDLSKVHEDDGDEGQIGKERQGFRHFLPPL